MQLLSTDKKALATARRLGFFSQQPQPQGRASAVGSAAMRSQGAGPAPASAGPSARQRKRAARSAQHHAKQRARQRWNRCCTAVLCMVRLRLCVRRRVLEQSLVDIGTLSDGGGAGASPEQPSQRVTGVTGTKRRSDRPASSTSHSSSQASSSDELANFHDGGRDAVPGSRPYTLPQGWQSYVDPRSMAPYYVCEHHNIWQWEHPCEGCNGAMRLRLGHM